MLPFLWPLLGAALGGVKSAAVDAPRERRERQLAATTQRLNPWTNLQAKPINYADPFGNVLQGGLTGLSMGQSAERSKLLNDLLKKQSDSLNVFSVLGREGLPDDAFDSRDWSVA